MRGDTGPRGLVLLAVVLACATVPHSSMLLERRGSPLATVGPDAVALPVIDRYRHGVVLGSVMTAAGERGFQRSYILGIRCLGFQPVRRRVEVRVGQVLRAVVTMRPQPIRNVH